MSHTYYNNLWADAQKQIRGLILEEHKFTPGVEVPDEANTTDILIDMFIKYVETMKKMDVVYDQVVHPQKRPLIRQLLDLLIVRILELREFLVDSELSEFFYMDHYLSTVKYLPGDVDIPIPRYYYHERDPIKNQMEAWLESEHQKKVFDEDRLSSVLRFDEEEDEYLAIDRTDLQEELSLSYERAVRFIQTAERARQGRARYEMAKYIYEEEEKARGRKKRLKQQLMEPNDAAVIIQRLVRRFIAKRKVQRRRNEELEFLGMTWSPHNLKTPMGNMIQQSRCWRNRIELHEASRRQLQQQYHKNYLEAQQLIESRLRTMQGPEMAESMKIQIRNWFLEVKERRGKLPDLPKNMEGGLTSFLFSAERFPDSMSMSEEEDEDVMKKQKTKASKQTEKAEGGSGRKQKGKGKGKKSKEGKGAEAGGPTASKIGPVEPPKHMEEFLQANNEYNNVWRFKNEIDNPHQIHEESTILSEKQAALEKDVRNQVDTVMKSELAFLKDALSRKKGKKGKKGKKSGRSGKGSKKGKKKKKKGKDLTPDRTFESLYCELVYNGVIRKYPKIRLNELIGDSSVVNGTIRRYHEIMIEMKDTFQDSKSFPSNPHPMPSFGDVKRILKEVCILPMGSSTVHQKAPMTKSVLLTGPTGSGKKSLVYAICTELGATLFDLTPANIAGKYPGKPGLTMLTHLIAKVGRLAQPTVILIDECEKTYQKRVAKTDKTEPKRLKKPLAKFLKTVGPDDQILLIGISAEPWAAPIKLLKKDFQKIIYIPKADHGDRVAIWQSKLSLHSSQLHEDINFSLLAKLSDGWTIGSIMQVIGNVLKRHYNLLEEENRKRERSSRNTANESGPLIRPSRVGRKLIRMDDFIKELSQFDPLFFEQEKGWTSWFSKTPLQRDRILAAESRLLEIKMQAEQEENEQKEKSKKPKAKAGGKKKKKKKS